MGVLTSLFSTNAIADNAGKIVDGAISGLDSLVLTDEEKLEFSKQFINSKIEFLKATQPYKLAQRILAFFIIANFFLAFWVGVLIYFTYNDLLKGYIELISTFQLGWIAIAVITFYFKPEAISSLFKGKK